MKNNPSLGQNWLKDRPTLETIADLVADLPESALDIDIKLCLEIGPGLGTLTSSLLKRFETVLAIEFDPSLAKNLPKSFPGKNLIVKNQDFLSFDLESISEPFVVAANIPYYITSPIIEKLLLSKNQPKNIVLLVQKEVAEKICDSAHSSSLSLFVDNYAVASLGPVVHRELFTPPPKVDSRVLILAPRKFPKTPPEANILPFVRRCFASPRKKLIKNLAFLNLPVRVLTSALSSLNLSLDARPADLSLEDYANLAKILKTD